MRAIIGIILVVGILFGILKPLVEILFVLLVIFAVMLGIFVVVYLFFGFMRWAGAGDASRPRAEPNLTAIPLRGGNQPTPGPAGGPIPTRRIPASGRPRSGRVARPKPPIPAATGRQLPIPPDRPVKLDGSGYRPCAQLLAILGKAYKCKHFGKACRTMRWAPAEGHIPRGFCGATGSPAQVKVVLVIAEPGDPQPGDQATMEEAIQKTVGAFAGGTGLFHKNARRLLTYCFPGLAFEEQLKRVWITESVLCSAVVTTGPVDREVENACGGDYLKAQLALMPKALVVALGGKAHSRLQRLGIPHEQAHALAPPGCNQKAADPSWQRIGNLVRSRG